MGFGSMAGGFVQGWQQQSENELKQEEAARKRKEWEDAQALKSRIAAAQGIGVTDAASGEQAASAGQRALEQAMSVARTDEERAQIQKDYAPTIQALDAQKATPAGYILNGKFSTSRPDDAAVEAERNRETLAVVRGHDPMKAIELEGNILNLNKARRNNKREESIANINSGMKDYLSGKTKNADGTERQLSDDDWADAERFRQGKLYEIGEVDEAMKLRDAIISRRLNTLKSNEAERKADASTAARAALQGDYKVAMGLYNKHVNDGFDAVDAADDNKGGVVITFKDKASGATKTQAIPKAQVGKMIEVMGGDADTLAKIEQRNFENGLAKRKVDYEGARVGIAQNESNRSAEKWKIEKPELEAKAGDSTAQRSARKELMEAIGTGDAKIIEAAKAKAIAAGVKFEKPSLEFVTTTDQMGRNVTRTNKDTGALDIIDPKTGTVKSIPAPGQAPNVTFANEAEAERAKRDGRIKAGDKVTIGGRPVQVN